MRHWSAIWTGGQSLSARIDFSAPVLLNLSARDADIHAAALGRASGLHGTRPSTPNGRPPPWRGRACAPQVAGAGVDDQADRDARDHALPLGASGRGEVGRVTESRRIWVPSWCT